MNHLNPLSPSKRVNQSFSPVSSPKKQRIIEETATQALTTSAKDKLLATIERLKGRLNLQKPALKEFIVKRDVEGLKAAFDYRVYHAGNEKGKKELIEAVLALKEIQNREEDEGVDQLSLALAELMIRIEDPEFLAEMEFQDFFSDCPIDFNTTPLLVVLNGTLSFICEYPLEALKNYRSDVLHYTAMHYAASQGDFEIFIWLKQQGFDPLQESKDGSTPLDFLFKAIAKRRLTPTACLSLFESLFCNERLPTLKSRLVAAMCIVAKSVCCDAWQIAVLAKKKMAPWSEAWEELAQEAGMHLAELPDSVGKMALQGSMEDVKMRDVKERTLLHWAVVLENRPLIEKLVQTEQLNQVDWYLRSPLHLAAVVPGIDPSILQLIAAKNPQLVLKGDSLGYTPVKLALDTCLYQNFKALFTQGMAMPPLIDESLWYAATNQLGSFRASLASGESPRIDVIHCAVALGHHEIVEECLKHELKWHLPNRQGYTPLALAVQNNDAALIEMLFADIERHVDPLNREMILDLLKLSLKHPDDIDYFFHALPPEVLFAEVLEGYTPHHLAKCYGGPALARRLKESTIRLQPLLNPEG